MGLADAANGAAGSIHDLSEKFVNLSESGEGVETMLGKVLKKFADTKELFKFENALIDIQVSSFKSTKKLGELTKTLKEMSKGSTYSTQQLMKFTAVMQQNIGVAGMSNKQWTKVVELMTKKFPKGAEKATASLAALAMEYTGLMRSMDAGMLNIDDSSNELALMNIALEGNFKGFQQATGAMKGFDKENAEMIMAQREVSAELENSRLAYAESQKATSKWGMEMDSAGAKAYGFLKPLKEVITNIITLRAMGKGLGWLFGSGGGAAAAGGGAKAAGAAGTAARGGMMARAAALPGAGAAGPIAGGIALTAAGIYGTTKLMDKDREADYGRKGAWGDYMRKQRAIKSNKADKAKRGGGEEGEKTKAEELLKIVKQKLVIELKEQKVLTKLAEISKSRFQSELGMMDQIDAGWATRVGLQEKIISGLGNEIRSMEKEVQLMTEVAAKGRKAAETKLKAAKASGDEVKVRKILADLNLNDQIIEGKRLEILKKRHELMSKGVEKINKEAALRKEELDIEIDIVEAKKSVMTALKTDPATIIRAEVQATELLIQNEEILRSKREQIVALREKELAKTTSIAEKDAVRDKYGKLLNKNSKEQAQLAAEIANKVDYIRRSWMEQYTKMSLGADTGTYLVGGASAMSGLQTQGAAFRPWGPSRAGGGAGTQSVVTLKGADQ